ncbi:alpha/beta hydrolase [Pseudoxanthomonas koreensis]|uniref:alpha/beta hydrolase n=1 Tax=Pseudoxanthomonas koreensis TaxID=266061 RepID=UPI001390FCC3|nr:alpha/beta hydrolase [Pseudoxanthomonas koreensis]
MIRPAVCLAALFALTACQPPVRLMPAPALFLNGEHNLFAANANLDRSARIQVFYATNRLAFGPDAAPAYTVFPGDELNLGVATLDIGGGAQSWDWLYEQSTSASAERRPQLLVNSMDQQATVAIGADPASPGAEALAYLARIDQALAESADPDLTIYVHGANTSVGRATAQAAQYRHFTGRNSVVLSYIWPSAENFMRFSHDVSKAGQTAPAFAQLVRMLAQHTRARHIDVIAYSSGAMVASPGLAILGTPAPGYDPASVRLGEVYFPAPDADFRTFVRELQVYHGWPERVTVTVNMRDSVLVLSRLHQRGSRAGRPDPNELDEEQAQWMAEASRQLDFDLVSARAGDLPGMERRSHIFWYDHPWVSSDVLLKMLFHMPPEQRGLQRNRTGDGLEYWSFPVDYEARLDGVMDDLVQTAARRDPAP